MAPIRERDEAIRSADPNVSKSRAMAAAAQQMPVQNRPSGYNSGVASGNGAYDKPPPRRLNNQVRASNHNNAVAQHRSPVIPAGKESIMLPPIETDRGRAGHGSASRQDPLSNLRSNGAAILGVHDSSSARNLHQYRSGSRNGSDGVRDSMNMGAKKYMNGAQQHKY